MAKGQKRSTREKKKPKQDKSKPNTAAPSFTATLAKASAYSPGRKK